MFPLLLRRHSRGPETSITILIDFNESQLCATFSLRAPLGSSTHSLIKGTHDVWLEFRGNQPSALNSSVNTASPTDAFELCPTCHIATCSIKSICCFLSHSMPIIWLSLLSVLHKQISNCPFAGENKSDVSAPNSRERIKQLRIAEITVNISIPHWQNCQTGQHFTMSLFFLQRTWMTGQFESTVHCAGFSLCADGVELSVL